METTLRLPFKGVRQFVLGKSVKDKQTRAAYLFILPALAFFAVHYIFPVLYDLYLTVFRFSFVEAPTFAGLEFYVAVFRDKLFWRSLGNTFYLALLSVPATMALSLVVAALLDGVKNRLVQNVFRTVYFLPVVTSGVAIAFVWSWMFEPSPNVGLINTVLARLGLPARMWLTSTKEVMPSIAIMNIWARLGFDMIIFMAGLQSIPEVYYEAARMDGASRVRSFFHITLPLLNPQIVLVAVYEVINVLKTFDIPYVATDGGPANASRVAVLHIYDKAFRFNGLNEATVAALMLFVIILAITVLQWRLLNRPVDY
jgi:multiple sugar transport system permease protein